MVTEEISHGSGSRNHRSVVQSTTLKARGESGAGTEITALGLSVPEPAIRPLTAGVDDDVVEERSEEHPSFE